jgi:hypothetical protein
VKIFVPVAEHALSPQANDSREVSQRGLARAQDPSQGE